MAATYEVIAGHHDGAARGSAGAGPGWTSSGASRAASRSSSGADAVQRLRAGERLGGQAQAGRAGDRAAHRPRPARRGERDRAPRANGVAELEHTLVEGVEQRLRLARGQRLDAERGRGRDEHALEPVGAARSARAAGVVGGEVERRRRLAGQLERPAAVVAAQPRAARVRRASSRSSGSGQRCWCRSVATSPRQRTTLSRSICIDEVQLLRAERRGDDHPRSLPGRQRRHHGHRRQRDRHASPTLSHDGSVATSGPSDGSVIPTIVRNSTRRAAARPPRPARRAAARPRRRCR